MAIAYDASSYINDVPTGVTTTFTHPCSGSNRILFVATATHGAVSGVSVTGVTYGGAAMTLIGTKDNGANALLTLWYIVAPSTGINNVVITKNVTDYSTQGYAISYTGASQTGQPDASSTGGPTTTGSYSQSVTTVVDNCWALMIGAGTSGLTLTAGSNTTIRFNAEVVFTGSFLVDTNSAKTPAGTDTLAVTSSSQSFFGVMASFAPALIMPGFATTNLVVSTS